MKINGELVKPIDVETHIDESKKSILKPHVFELIGDAVSAFGVVGIRPGKIVGDEDGINSRELSGITVICNDRVVLFCNKDWSDRMGGAPSSKLSQPVHRRFWCGYLFGARGRATNGNRQKDNRSE